MDIYLKDGRVIKGIHMAGDLHGLRIRSAVLHGANQFWQDQLSAWFVNVVKARASDSIAIRIEFLDHEPARYEPS